jgi:hypothetical protein
MVVICAIVPCKLESSPKVLVGLDSCCCLPNKQPTENNEAVGRFDATASRIEGYAGKLKLVERTR